MGLNGRSETPLKSLSSGIRTRTLGAGNLGRGKANFPDL